MICGTLSNLDRELRLYPQAIQTALRFLQQADVRSLAIGKHPIQGSDIVALVSEYDTEPCAVRRPESHRKYVDVQFVGAGEEAIGAAPLQADYEVVEDCLTERDVVFYKGCRGEIELKLSAGMFAVFFPWDVHRPNCMAGAAPARVKKVVIKVAVDLL
jgi:YhcH/YjgK/YiaL family protein